MADKSSPSWVPRARDYVLEGERMAVKQERVQLHPLVPGWKPDGSVAAAASRPARPKDDPLRSPAAPMDPLRSPSAAVAFDPLRATASSPAQPRAAADEHNAESKDGARKALQGQQGFEEFRSKKAKILSKYTTNKRIPVSANFLDDDVKEGAAPKEVNQLKSRLEQLELDAGETDEARSYMNQKEYIAHIEKQHDRLKKAWDDGERVLALKIAIQCAKLMGDTTVPQFYPSMWILLADTLDTFGELVFQRIKQRGVETMGVGGLAKATALPADFQSSDVSPQAKETSRNWFYKTACIRELMGRLYIDLALIKNYRFTEDTPFEEILTRCAKIVRGIGDPLAAAYARAYVADKAIDISAAFLEKAPAPGYLTEGAKRALLLTVDDFFFSWRAMRDNKFEDIPVVQQKKITLDEYLDLFTPAVEWLMQNVGHMATEELFYATCQQYKECCNNSVVLHQILLNFRPQLVSKHAQTMVALIKDAEENSQVPKSKLYLALGRALMQFPPPPTQRLPVLNEVWKVVTKLQSPDEYMDVAEVFVAYVLQNFGERELNVLLKDVLKHAKKEHAHVRLQAQLAGMIEKIMASTKDIDATLSMDNLLPIIDLLEKKTKVESAKVILSRFAELKLGTISDPVIIHTLFDVARSLHDSVDSMTFDDDRRQISSLIVAFIRKIDFGRDLERQLGLYVDFRQAFTNLDAVTMELVLRVALLTSLAHRLMKGKHNKKTATFVKACLAYCLISIPSLDDVFAKLRLFLESAKVALVNQMVVEAEDFVKAAINLIPSVPAYVEVSKVRMSTEEDLVSFLRNLAAFLLLFPGHPEHGPFYLVRALLNHLHVYEPWKSASQGKIRVYMGILALLCTYAQRNFPYHIDRVESNDSLYGGDPSYLEQLGVLIEAVVKQILQQLAEIGEAGDLMARKRQGSLALEFANQLIGSVEMNAQTATVVVKLIQLAKKNESAVDPHFLRNTLSNMANRKGTWYQEILAKAQ